MIATMMWVIIVIIILVLLMILVFKMTKKYQITWYWCQNIRENIVEKRVKISGRGLTPPPFSGNARKKTFFLSGPKPWLPIVVIEGGDFQLTCAKKHLSGLLNPDSVCKKRLQSFRNDLCTSPPSTSGEWERVQSVRDRAGWDGS